MQTKNYREAVERAKSRKEPLVFFDASEIDNFDLTDLPFLGTEIPEGWKRGKLPVSIFLGAHVAEIRKHMKVIEEEMQPKGDFGYGLTEVTPYGVQIYTFWRLERAPIV
jgi:hypothetical protein